jgi:hypothetical protein
MAGVAPNATQAYEAACAYALVAAHEPEDPSDDAARRLRSVASDKAIALLQFAFADSEFRRSPRFARLAQAPELDALRSRTDFPTVAE